MSTFPKYFFSSTSSNFKLISKLFWVILILKGFQVSEAVEFSQFHLPPCCYIPGPSNPLPGGGPGPYVASAPSEQNGTYTKERPHPRGINSGDVFVREANTYQVYKMVVPLKFPTSKAASASLYLTPPPPTQQSISVSEESPPSSTSLEQTITPPPPPFSSTFKSSKERDSVKDAGSDVFNVFLQRELERSRNRNQRNKNKDEIPSEDTSLPKKEESVFERLAQLGFSVSNRLQQLSTQFSALTPTSSSSIAVRQDSSVQNSHGPYQMYKTFVKRQADQEPPMKMPAVWLKNLRKALFQSLSTRNRPAQVSHSPTSNSFENQSQGSYNGYQMDNKLLWKHLRTAQLKFIDLASRSTSDLPEEIYLPAGKGPIVSGIAALAGRTGQLELRIPSELYTPQDSHGAGSGEGSTTTSEFCKCDLIGEGDMVLAYWSISRIITEDGQPALQYLVFPHPHPYHTVSPPTPPHMLPFNDNYNFKPSPLDPVPNYLNEISNQNRLHHQKFPIVPERGQAHGRHRIRTPKFLQQFGPGPAPNLIPHPSGLPPVPIQNDPRGVPIDYNGKYTDDFLSLYRDAINHHFQNLDSMKSFGPNFPNQPFPNIPPQQAPPPPYHFAQGPPTSIPGIATPVNPSPIPQLQHQGQGLPHHQDPDHPRSIQDIIQPFVPTAPGPPPQGLQGHRGGSHIPQQYPYDQQRPLLFGEEEGPNFNLNQLNQAPPIRPYRQKDPNSNNVHRYDYPEKRPHGRPSQYGNGQEYLDNRHPHPNRYSDRDMPRKQSHVKEYYSNYKASGVRNTFAHRYGGGIVSKLKKGTINDIDNPDGYILDFK